MRAVPLKTEILILETKDVFDRRIKTHRWQRQRIALKLPIRLLQVVGVNVCITQGMYKITRF